MNGSNSLDESDKRPPYLCPICLRKLQYVISFSNAERIKKIIEFLNCLNNEKQSFIKQIEWYSKRLEFIKKL